MPDLLGSPPSLDALLAMSPAERQAAKERRLFARLGQPCRFYGAEETVRSVSIRTVAANLNDEYVKEPTQVAEFLRSQGSAAPDDEFETGSLAQDGSFTADGRRYRLTAPFDMDDSAVCFVIVQL
ncbi:hypothetical protein MJ923_07875 [Shewanella sp. 3B26]|uniref:Uncharacterized protein n=1 Tax=Shewanella zhuhaiensis TaxID=2919576 RepID=A0AAJ1BG57_9GAMM|nr:hypothetical protein [Shewanella zhuhaiensis]MCH4294222.1 hypothetical protein [Shewanella zhuhaiensis]